MKISETLNAARLRAGAILRERRERAAERKAARRIVDPPGVTVFEWQVRTAHILSWGAWGIAAFFFWSYCIGTAGDQASELHLSRAGIWRGDLRFFFPLIIGFAGLSLAIPYLAKSIIPIFVVFSWRTHFWPKLACLVLVLGASFALIASSFSVMGGAIIEHGRGAAVATEQVQNQRGALQAQIDGITADLRASTDGNSTQAQAARVGMLAGSPEAARAQWERSYVGPAEAARDPNVERIRRATGSAEAAAAAVARRETLRAQLGAATTVASVEGTPVTTDTAQIADSMALVRLSWPIIMSVLNDIVCLFLGWIAYHLEKIRSMQLGMVEGIALHPYMLNDQSATTRANRDPQRRAARDVADAFAGSGVDPRFAADMMRSASSFDAMETNLKNADTDETIIDKDGHLARTVREHTRKVKGKDGKPIQMMVPGAPPEPDDVGVPPELDGRDAELRATRLPFDEEAESLSGSIAHPGDKPAFVPDDTVSKAIDQNVSPDQRVEVSDTEVPMSNAGGDPATPRDVEPVLGGESLHSEPPEPDFTDEALQSINALAEEAVDEPTGEPVEPASMIDAEPEAVADERPHEPIEPDHDTTEPAREPETDPARLIAAVAAE